MISLEADGHTGRGSTCVDDAVDAFLLKGTLPPAALMCDLTSITA
jgi:hypothetical protein